MHDYRGALADWAAALKRDPRRYDFRVKRARAFYFAQELDSAFAELAILVDTLEARQLAKLRATATYRSKEMYLYQMVVIRERQGQRDAARDLYGRALTENLTWYMAHVRLTGLAVIAGDSQAAVSEWELAIQIRDFDPALHYRYAQLLFEMGRTDEASKQLRKAIELDAEYAPPYGLLGRAENARAHREEALRAYEEFARRAARTDPSLPAARERVTALGGKTGSGRER